MLNLNEEDKKNLFDLLKNEEEKKKIKVLKNINKKNNSILKNLNLLLKLY